MLNPVDPTTTPAWKRLTELHDTMTPDLRAWFADDPQRAERFSYELGDLYVDLSKNLLTDDVRDALVELAEQVDVPGRRDAMYAGEHINITEDRAVLHTALRRPATDSLTVDGQDVVADVHEVLEKIYAFARRVRSGEWTGITGKPIKTVVNIGIGGSDLGPVMVYEALKPYVQKGLQCRFISNIDPTDCAEKVADLDPETTLFIIASKTFTTLETLTNARMARDWFLAALQAKGIETDGAIAKHFVAVSTALDKVAEFGIDPANAFGFWNWVGGRYSVDSAVGTVLAVAIGSENFADFLSGFHTVDEHFATKAPAENVPMLMGLLNVWYVNFFKAGSHAVLPYAQYLHRFPAYLQQLTMESNGKSVRWDGSPVTTETGEVFWGEPGTNGQHAFYQLIHQGTQLIPADFIAVANPAHPTKDGGVDVHELFLSNYLAQTAALAFGKTADEVRAEGTAEEIVPARVFAGNKPTTSILGPALTPAVVGELIALYEHITFTQGIVWGIDSFDQWGVELGKKLALEIAPAVQGDEESLAGQDASTRGLITRYAACVASPMHHGSHSAAEPYAEEPHVHVRTAGTADAPCIGRLLFDFNTEFDAPTPSVQELTSRFQTMLTRQDVLVLLAEDSSADQPRAVGFAYLTLRPTPYSDGPVAELEEFYVQPECRSRGIGSQLLGQAREQVRLCSALEMRIGVDEADTDARRFYERHGFRNVEPGETSRMLCYVSDPQPLRRT